MRETLAHFQFSIPAFLMLGLHYLAGLAWGWAALVAFVGWPFLFSALPAGEAADAPPPAATPPLLPRVFGGLAFACLVASVDPASAPGYALPLGVLGGAAAIVAITLYARRRGE